MFRIAAFAGLAGVSAKTLRAWDGLGLFRPAWTDRGTGYRYYSAAQLPELRRIVALRDLGLTLSEVAGLVAGGADLGPALDRRRRELEAERREVERRLRAVRVSVAMAEAGSAGPDVVIQPVRRELVATRAVLPHEDDGEAFYEVEAVVRDLGLRADRPPMSLLEPPGREVAVPDEVAIPVTRRFPGRGRIAVRELPGMRVASAIHRGSYAGLAEVKRSLEAWVRAADLEPTGRVRVVYLQFGAEPELRVPPAYVVERSVDFVTELQLELA